MFQLKVIWKLRGDVITNTDKYEQYRIKVSWKVRIQNKEYYVNITTQKICVNINIIVIDILE